MDYNMHLLHGDVVLGFNVLPLHGNRLQANMELIHPDGTPVTTPRPG